MKNLRLFTLLLTALLLSSACKQHNVFSIEGTLENGAGNSLYIEELSPDGPIFIDSIKLDDNGHFEFRHEMSYETFYNLHHSETDYVVLLPQEEENIVINGNYKSLQWSYKVSGSQESTLLWQLQDYSNYGIERLMDILQQDQANRSRYGDNSDAYKEAKKVTDSIYREAAQEQVDYIAHFIQEHQGSLTTLIALYKQFNQHDIISPKVNFDYYELVLEGLESSLPDNPHTIHFKNRVENLRHYYGQSREALDMVFDGQ